MVMAEATNHYFKHLGVSDGLSQVCIPSIYQDELGAVWLGTTEGLNRYNGKDVKVFQPSESNHGLTNNEINELCGDKNGRMYIRSAPKVCCGFSSAALFAPLLKQIQIH